MTEHADLTGKIYGRLTVLKRHGRTSYGKVQWECVCICGKSAYPTTGALNSNRTKSCGCLSIEKQKERFEKHGHSKGARPSKTYESWLHMRQRCLNKNEHAYKNYGGRGIVICQRWNEFQNFLNDMGEMPNGYSIERIDCNGNYEPSNCKWIPKAFQSRNTRRTVSSVEISNCIRKDFKDGMKRREIISKYGMCPGTVDSIIYNKNWINNES